MEKIILCRGQCKDNPTEAWAEHKELVKQLEEEVSELQRRNTELEQLSHTEDDLHLLQVSGGTCNNPCITTTVKLITDFYLMI